ncbi:MAG: 50S ribosomal protein L3 N(5)-glutamine methyltransferase [Hyphomicrobium sp.]
MSEPRSDDLLDDLITIRDWLRHAVGAFDKAELAFGHGASTAIDEAAFLILASLNLPIDAIDPWLDCRLTRRERTAIRDLIAARIEKRKPAAYLLNAAYIQGRKFYVDERVIVPRSFIGELLASGGLAGIIPNADSIERALDLCTGSGCLAILAAEAFCAAKVDAADVSPDALAVAARNVGDYGLENRIALIQSDLFAALAGKRYDVIVSNPPYVTAAAVAAFPPEYRAEPQIAHLGGADGLDFVHRILSAAADHLTDDGAIVVEIGEGREALEAARPDLPFLWLDTETSAGEVFALQAADLTNAAQRRR